MALWSVPVVLLALLAIAVWWMTGMPGRSHSGALPALSVEETQLQERLKLHVHTLAGEIGERNVFRPEALAYAGRYIEERLREMGHQPVRENYSAASVDVWNVIVERRGKGRPDEIVVVGAHYDSVMGSPGANDNATGAAALLEIARDLARRQPESTVRCVFFVNEEPPFFLTGEMGSVVHARRTRERGENVVAMLSIETIGYYTDAKGSQHYPFPLGLLYPGTGDFIGFVGNMRSRDLVRRAVRSFRASTAFPSEGAAAPGSIPGVGWSDHWSFWQQGYPAVMVTDTAPFRYGPYHTREDTPDKVGYERMARVVAGLERVVADLAGGGTPGAGPVQH